MNLNNFSDGDIDDRFSDARNIRILVDIEHHFRLVNITDCSEELPTTL